MKNKNDPMELMEVEIGDFVIMYDNNRKGLPLIRYCFDISRNDAFLLVLSFESKLLQENFTEFGSYYTAPALLAIVLEKFSLK